ncbi:MAG: ASPIC/UnbV domain-containing protein, partial [Proteobacteria bacterium]|nr:ASPIC/UnbV domain-containing protein [Pseudomonadota bacterium]
NNFHDPAVFLRNNAEKRGNHWVKVKLIGDPEKGSNRDAIGARLYGVTPSGRRLWREVHGGTGYLSMDPKEQHFGLGAEDSLDLKIVWPGGGEQESPGVVGGSLGDGVGGVADGDATARAGGEIDVVEPDRIVDDGAQASARGVEECVVDLIVEHRNDGVDWRVVAQEAVEVSLVGVALLRADDDVGAEGIERFRRPLLAARLLAATGRIERDGLVIHVVAERLRDLTPRLRALTDALAADAPLYVRPADPALETHSRDFR